MVLKPGFGIAQDATPFWPMHHGGLCADAPGSGLCTWSGRERISEVHSEGIAVFVLTNSPQCWESDTAHVMNVDDSGIDIDDLTARLLDPRTPTVMLDGVTVPPYFPGFTHPLVEKMSDRLQLHAIQIEDQRRLHSDFSIRYLPRLPTDLLTVPEIIRIHHKWSALGLPGPEGASVNERAAAGDMHAIAAVLSDLAEHELSSRVVRAHQLGIDNSNACRRHLAVCRQLRPDAD